MAIPPIAPQDLAKLVLGYLAEEQLMSVYDEFLQASPYLFRNEYDRIFMTSLRNILSEYRAVKIYVETCKPLLLREKLLQCSNLFEVVKFLLSHVDINRLHAEECMTTEKISVKQSYFRSNNGCDVCNSLNLGACMCKRAQRSVSSLHPSQMESNFGSSTETTTLDDLPGNSINKNNNNCKNEEWNKTILSNNQLVKEHTSGAGVIHSVINTTYEPHLPIVVNEDKPHQNLNTQDVLTVNSDETQQKIIGSSDKEMSRVTDSSSAENFVMQSTVSKENNTNINPITKVYVNYNIMPKMPPLQPISQAKTYNKGEIMAMPYHTNILVPASGAPSSTFTSVSVAQNVVCVSSNTPNPVEISYTKKRKCTSEVAEESVSKKTKPETRLKRSQSLPNIAKVSSLLRQSTDQWILSVTRSGWGLGFNIEKMF